MTAYLYRVPVGIPGDISRQSQAQVEAAAFNSAVPFPGYGLPGKLVLNGSIANFEPISAVADVPYGFLVRPFPTQGANASDPLGTAVPSISGIASVMVKGYMTVKCNAGVPEQGGAVYVRYANGAANTPVGGIEAAAVANTTQAIPNARFMGPADANGNVEIYFDNP